MHRIVNDEALDILFRSARDHYAWLDRPVSDTLLRAVWELIKRAPEGVEAGEPRIVFVKSKDGKARLASALSADSHAALAAPTVAVIGWRDAAARPHPPVSRDAGLHGGWLILAARALGIDCVPIWEFAPALVEAAVFADGMTRAVFLCALGYGDPAQAAPRTAGREFDEACIIL
jgi:3-hydroxypropanoate dehydrogenase